MGALGVSTNNAAEADKVGAYFIGKLSPVYEGLRTNEFFPQMENYRKEVEATFALAAGLKQLAQLPDYCASNNISQDDLSSFLNGCVINDLAYMLTPISEEARKQYIALAESSSTNGVTAFYSGPYSNWESLSAFLDKRKACMEELQRKKDSKDSTPKPTPTPLPSPEGSPQPTATPAG